MKKLILAMALLFAMPLTFTSCDNTDDLGDLIDSALGSAKVTVGGKSQSYTGVGYYEKDGHVYIATTGTEGSLGVKLDGSSLNKEYTLGVASDNVLSDILSSGANLSFDKFSNIMLYFPKGEAKNPYIVIKGSLTLTGVSGNQLKGTFKGSAVPYSYLTGLYSGGTSVSDILKLITGSNNDAVSIEGKISAKNVDVLGDLF